MDDGIWAWIDRLDSEILPPSAEEERVEAMDAELMERVIAEGPAGLDVPLDYYADPAHTLEGDPLLLDQLDLAEFDIPVEINDHVKRWLRFFIGSHRKHTKRYLERKARYEDFIYAELDKAGMPRDLIYLAMVESGFNAFAYSHAHASGLWQFISSTGRMYGMQSDFWIDERRDPEIATRAAIRYLSDLSKMFDGDLLLAMASYNTGPGRVRRARSSLSSLIDDPTYWHLIDNGKLPRETSGYVPKIVAVAIIGHHPERYGFTDLDKADPLHWDSVSVEGSVDVALLAKLCEMTEEEFRVYNPALRQATTPSGKSLVHIPRGTSEVFIEGLADIPPAERVAYVTHKVRSGESLSAIAGRYGVSTWAVQSVNNIRNPNRIYVGMRLTIPVRGRSGSASSATATVAAAPAPAAPRSSKPVSRPTTYKVRRGDTLSGIADRYGMRLSELSGFNGLSTRSRIYVGQVLKLQGSASSSSGAASTPAAPTSTPTSYTVRSGDTLSAIATRFGVSMSDLQRWNSIGNPSSIRVGQRIKVYGGKDSGAPAASTKGGTTTTYTVRRGDTLWGIASKHGVSQSDLQSWNGIRDASSIYPGQRLKIKQPTVSWTTHTVKSGESLGIIASRYGVSLSSLRGWNGLRGSTIYPGQKLKIQK